MGTVIHRSPSQAVRSVSSTQLNLCVRTGHQTHSNMYVNSQVSETVQTEKDVLQKHLKDIHEQKWKENIFTKHYKNILFKLYSIFVNSNCFTVLRMRYFWGVMWLITKMSQNRNILKHMLHFPVANMNNIQYTLSYN